MPRQSTLRRLLAIAAICLCCGAAAPKPAETIPALPPELTDRVSKSVPTGKLKDSATDVEQFLTPILAEAGIKQPELLIPLSALREYCRYFGRLTEPTPSQVTTLQWLLTKPRLLQTLMLAISSRDLPDKVLPVLDALRKDHGDKLEEYPDLAAAMCVVWDQPYRQDRGVFREIEAGEKTLSQPRMLMRYYLSSRQLQFNVQQLPWPLAAYLVDNAGSADDMAWATNRYGGRSRIGAVFFDVEYDYEKLNGTNEGALAEKNYSLENIFKNGGICGDQAYFAAQVSRAIGVPAIICTGVNANEGTGHAWVGFLSTRGQETIWDFDEGRYEENRYWRGSVIDPQTRDRITDADVAVLADLMTTPPRDRLASAALTKVTDLVSESQRPAMLMQAVNLSPGNSTAWRQLAQLAARQKLAQKELTSFGAAVSKYAVKDFPDFAFSLLKLANTGRSTEQQIKALQEMERMFSSRPDLQADVYIALADLYQSSNNPQQAYNAYTHVLDRYSNISPIVAEAMDHLDKMLTDLKAWPQLVDIYQSVWTRMPQPDSSIAVRGTAYYKIGQRYAEILTQLGQTGAAQNVNSRLESLSTTIVSARRSNGR